MRFNPKARLDTSQVRVRRGGGGGLSRGGMRLPFPSGGGGGRGGAVGGGIGGILLLVLVFVIVNAVGGNGGGLDGALGGASPASDEQPVSTSELTQCRTGADANEDPDCARVAVVNSIQAFWTDALPRQAGREYAEGDTVMFAGQVDTRCGAASSDVGPFYCPADQQVYLDTRFFTEVLEGRLGGSSADFAEAYVLAHEYGHHVQNLLGTMGRVRTQQGPDSDAVRLELQADCYAGMWTRFATQVPGADGQVLIAELTQQDVDEALDAAEAVGDDSIQERVSGRADPESFTHGTSAQRKRWFSTGYEQGTLRSCDTFAASRL